MEINISDDHTIKRLNQLADQLDQTPEQIVVEAIEQFQPPPRGNGKAFWNAIRGIGESGDPELARKVKEILRTELDPKEGWNNQRDADSSNRQ
jgi:hypothetical protein